MVAFRPTTLQEIAEVVRESDSLRVIGADSRQDFRIPSFSESEIRIDGYVGIVDFWPEDQVVAVKAGTQIDDLQAELDAKGQCLPLVEWNDGWSHLNDILGTVGGELSMNLPHHLEAECGTWRDWVLGMTVVMAEGTVVKVGSRAVKNVAGYDLQKLMIGARGTLAVVAEVTLRTFPSRSLPEPRSRPHGGSRGSDVRSLWIQRVQPTDYDRARSAASEWAGFDHPASSTVIRNLPNDQELPRIDGDWVIRAGCGDKNLQITDPTLIRYMRRAKDLFDPTHKLNPGEMGIF